MAPDVVCPENILWKHRRDGDTEIYFLSNQKDAARRETISFRVYGKVPELWWPETGRVDREPAFTVADGRVSVPVEFDIHTSVFVVFRKAAEVQERTVPGKENAAGSCRTRRAVDCSVPLRTRKPSNNSPPGRNTKRTTSSISPAKRYTAPPLPLLKPAKGWCCTWAK